MTGRHVPPRAPAAPPDRPAVGRDPGPVPGDVVREPASTYLRSPIFWAMMISAPILWALAILVVARIFHAALS